MKRHAAILSAILAAVLLVGSVPATAQTTPPPAYLLNFDNYMVSDPTPYGANAALGVLVHSRDTTTWGALEPMTADHGAHCEGPPATHPLTGSYADSVFICAANPHLMTSIKAGGYGVVYLTPGAMADWSGGETVISFDVSTLRTSGRDWWDVWVTPFDEAQAAPLSPAWPDLAGEPKDAIHIDMASFSGQSVHRGIRIDDFAETDLDSCWWCGTEDALAAVNLLPSASRRDTYELRISATHVRFSLLNPTTHQPLVTWVDKEMATPLPYSQGVVQIGHHSYNPDKACDHDGTCRADTWHWDNLAISRTAPLTLLPAKERLVGQANGTDTYTFGQPAPTDAFLQIEALATTLEYSLDNGATWAVMGQQASNTHKWGGMRTWRQPIPAGTQAVTLRGADETGTWAADGATIMAKKPNVPPTPTMPPAPTSTPVPTQTPVPPTPTTGATATLIPSDTPTASPAPASPTAVPPSTSTPFPATATTEPSAVPVACQVQVILSGTPGPLKECQ
jgi:hypothetical protein